MGLIKQVAIFDLNNLNIGDGVIITTMGYCNVGDAGHKKGKVLYGVIKKLSHDSMTIILNQGELSTFDASDSCYNDVGSYHRLEKASEVFK